MIIHRSHLGTWKRASARLPPLILAVEASAGLLQDADLGRASKSVLLGGSGHGELEVLRVLVVLNVLGRVVLLDEDEVVPALNLVQLVPLAARLVGLDGIGETLEAVNDLDFFTSATMNSNST